MKDPREPLGKGYGAKEAYQEYKEQVQKEERREKLEKFKGLVGSTIQGLGKAFSELDLSVSEPSTNEDKGHRKDDDDWLNPSGRI